MLTCPKCGAGEERLDIRPGSGPHHAKIVCERCGRIIRWVPKPIKAAQLRRDSEYLEEPEENDE